MLKLAYSYMRYYKSQTFAILASIILTAALLSGVSSLMYSSRQNNLENNKQIYGSWHYCIDLDSDTCNSIRIEGQDSDYQIECFGKKSIKDMASEPYPMYFIQTDEAYRQMAHRQIIDGRYPESADEIAADRYTLGNLGFSGVPGDTLTIDGRSFILTGIIESAWAADADETELFVGGGFTGPGTRTLLYLQFCENERLYRQLNAFLDKYRLPGDAVWANDEVTKYLNGEQPEGIYDIIKFGLTNEDGNFTYIVLKLQSEYNLAFYGMLLILCLFSIFIIHSIFNISVSKRTSEYGILEAIGISGRRIGGTLILELWLLFLFGYPAGCLLGNSILKLFYQKLDHVFTAKGAGNADIRTVLSETDRIFNGTNAESAVFHTAWDAMAAGFVFLFTALAFVGFSTVRSLRRQSIRQAISGDTSFIKRKRHIYSLRNPDLAHVVIRKFMFSSKKKVTGILLSLSLGGCMFLCTAYMAENLKVHAEMSLKSDDGLGSDYRISIKSDLLSDSIPAQTVAELKKIPELSQVYATRYTLGELTVQEHELEWDHYFDEANQRSYFIQRFGGICVQKDGGSYGIKYDVYGYDAGLLEQLQEFVLEGRIDPDELEQDGKIIAVANEDGQGNYNFYGKHPGDTITVKVPRVQSCSPEILKFQGAEENYIAEEFEITAIVSRALARENNFLNADSWSNMPSLIMANRQMKEQFGITDYSFVNASAADQADTDEAAGKLLQKIRDIPKAVLQDYTAAVETRKNHLRQQQLFFSGIAVILLVISLFHIMNSMNYSILSHRREYGILRAMGITDTGFYKMALQMGLLYGLLADLLIFLLYNLLLRRVMDYYMVHVVQFLHIGMAVPGKITALVMVLNILIAAAAVMIPARKIVKSQIISEII